MFSFDINRVIFDEELGSGAHGSVYAYQQKHANDDAYVVKRITTHKIETMISTVQEIVLGFSCEHKHVLSIKGYHMSYEESKRLWHIYIKMHRMQTSLKTRIEEYETQGKAFKEEDIARYFYSLVLGLRYLHNKHIAHRDIKPANILIDKHDNLKIADVGIAKLVEDGNSETLTSAAGTPLYLAPEILAHGSELKLKKRDLFNADIWSLGVIMAEICVPKTRLINTKTTGKANELMLAEILRGLQDRYSKALLELILSLLRVDPSKRTSLEEVQRVLEETYPDLLSQDNRDKNKGNRVEEENVILKSILSDLQEKILDLQNQLDALRLSPIEKDYNKNGFSDNQRISSSLPLTNPVSKREGEQNLEEKESSRDVFNTSSFFTSDHQSPSDKIGYYAMQSKKNLQSINQATAIRNLSTSNPRSIKDPLINEKASLEKNLLKSQPVILVVEDNPFNLLVCRHMLSSHKYMVKTATNGQEAIDIATQNNDEPEKIVLILMDCQMPVMDGLEATKILKRMMVEKKIPVIPIVALTVNDSEEDREICRKAGMVDHLSKPLGDAELERIKEYL